MTKLGSYVRNANGSAAAEFALILPGILFLLIGGFNLCAMTYAEVNLHSAVEGAARYASIQTNLGGESTLKGSCSTSGSVCNYVTHYYKGPAIGLAVTCTPSDCSANNCGHSVTATGSYHVYYGFGQMSVPLSATACFP